MNRSEIQYALNRSGYVDIDENSTIDGPIELGHLTGKVNIVSSNSSTLTFNSNSARHCFEYNYLPGYTHDPPELYFDNIKHDNESTYSGFFRVVQSGSCPARLHVHNCDISADGNYAIDCPSGGDMECVVIRDTQFGRGGAIRWHSSSTAYPDFIHMHSNRYLGTGKVGATFNFKNVQNLTMRLNILDGDVELITGLAGNYIGPVAILITNPIGVCVVDDFWFEPWSDWDTDAPDCWGVSVRTDDESGSYGQRMFQCANVTLNASGLSAGVKLNQFMGGHSSSNAASMLAYIHDPWKASTSSYLFGGKLRVIMERNADNTDMDDAIEAAVDGFVSGSYRDPLRVSSFDLPWNEFSSAEGDNVAYPGGTTLDDNWVARAQELEAF